MVQAFPRFGADACSSAAPEIKSTLCRRLTSEKQFVTIHQKKRPRTGIYHLSSCTGSQTYHELTDFSFRTTAA